MPRLSRLRTPVSRQADEGPACAPGFRLGHRPALDGLRGCAIVAVMLHHTFPASVPGGFFGVDVFFVLSGFLITALLVQEWQRTGSISLRHFYLRRALRLLPALVVFLLATWLFARLACPKAEERLTRHAAVSVLLYVFNWDVALRPAPYTLLLHAWSLSVEEQFYLVWPVLLLVLLRLRVPRPAVLGLVLVGIAAPAVERVLLWRGPDPVTRVYFGTDTRADALLMGCLVGLLASWDLLPRRGWPLAALRAAALLAVPVLLAHGACGHRDAYVYHGGLSVVAGAAAVLLAGLLRSPPRPLAWLLERPALVWTGRVSYGLYLWHLIVFCHVVPRLQIALIARGMIPSYSPVLQVLTQFPAVVAVVALSYYLVERPFLRLKDRLGRSAPVAPAPSDVPPAAAA